MHGTKHQSLPQEPCSLTWQRSVMSKEPHWIFFICLTRHSRLQWSNAQLVKANDVSASGIRPFPHRFIPWVKRVFLFSFTSSQHLPLCACNLNPWRHKAASNPLRQHSPGTKRHLQPARATTEIHRSFPILSSYTPSQARFPGSCLPPHISEELLG